MDRIAYPILAAVLAAATSVAAVPDIGTDISPFGSQIVWPQDPNLATYANSLQSAGVQWARSELIWWGLCEQQVGVYNFNVGAWNTDAWLSALQTRGIRPYAILSYGNDLHGGTPDTPAGRTAFANFTTALVGHYKDNVDVWEVWNEPNLAQFWGKAPNATHYAQLVAATAPAVRAADPDCLVVGGVTSGIDRAFLTTCFQNGMLAHIDALSVHPYRIDRPESINAEIASLRAEMNGYANGPNVRIWTGEWGYNAAWTELGADKELAQAKMLSRMMVNNLSQGIELSIWFSVHGWDPIEDWGLTDLSLQNRESHEAYRVLNERLPAPVAHVGNPFGVSFDPTQFTYRAETFQRGDASRTTTALWRQRWPPATDTILADVEMIIEPQYDVRAYDGLTGARVALDHLWDIAAGTLTLDEFGMVDYPMFVDANVETLPAGLRVPASRIIAYAADSEFPGFPASLSFDGAITVASKWTSQPTALPHWVAVQFSAPQDISGCVLRLPSMAGEFSIYGARAVELQTGESLSGPWTTVASATNDFRHDRIAMRLATPTAATFVRVVVTDSGVDAYARIPEIELYATTEPVPLETTVWTVE